MKKRFTGVCLLLALALSVWAEGKAKYVFYFIGDGMGVNQVNGTETYRGAVEGRIGITPLTFGNFPVVGLANTQSATNGVTDSAAGGTALATGKKTRNGALGVLTDGETRVTSVAQWAKESGRAVGVATSVSIDHATPAAFYAHVGRRQETYQIGKDMIAAGFDFYAGSDFLSPEGGKSKGEPSLYEQCKEAGYAVVRGYGDYKKKAKKAARMLLLQPEEASKKDRTALPYAIDRTKKDLTTADITRAGIHFLTKKNPDGFFLMVEGGKIDWACHANDAATMVHEVEDLDDAVRVAYEFYEQHPDETLIVVTADHETGGLSLGTGAYDLRSQLLKHQTMSIDQYGKHVGELRKKMGTDFTWEVVKADLTAHFGFWEGVKLNEHQTNRLKQACERLIKGIARNEETLYQKDNELATTAKRVLNEAALIGWQSGGHSNGYVPVFAIGVGAERFTGRMDNTEIPLKIAEAAGYAHP